MHSNSAEQMDNNEMDYFNWEETDWATKYSDYSEDAYEQIGMFDPKIKGNGSRNKEFSESKKVRQNEREQQRKMKRNNNNWEN